jgi:hypothetical protein
MSRREGVSLCLSIEEIERIAAHLKEDLQQQGNQGMRKKDWEQGISALASMECLDNFIYNCRLRAGAFSHASPEGAKPYSRRSVRVKEIRQAVRIEELKNKRAGK